MKPFNLEEYLKNPSRKIVTRDGRHATIHCTNCRGNFPIIAEIEGMNFSEGFTNDGGYDYVEKSVYKGSLYDKCKSRVGGVRCILLITYVISSSLKII